MTAAHDGHETWQSAKTRLRERGITEAQVKSTLEAPEIAYADEFPGREVRMKRFRGRRLRVILAKRKDDIFIISAVWTDSGSKP